MEPRTGFEGAAGPAGARGGGLARDRRRPPRRAAGQLLTFSARGVSVRFGPVRALDDVSIDVEPGEIHALLGENGAGKSTLASVLAGERKPDFGTVRISGRVGFVHQHFAIPPGLTSAELLAAARFRRPRFVGRRTLEDLFRSVETESGLSLGSPTAEAAALPVGLRQRLEFARAVTNRPDLLLLDEPTAVLTPSEIDTLLISVKELARRGTAVVLITHKLPEAFAAADRITLLRAGRVVVNQAVSDTTPAEIAALFLGPGGAAAVARTTATPGRSVLRLDHVSAAGNRGERALTDICLDVRRGEIVAIVGVDGNGQRELTEAIAGIRPAAGRIELEGSPSPPATFRSSGAGVVPGDRQREGLILEFTVRENLRLVEPLAPVSSAQAEERMRRFDIRGGSAETRAAMLSGGNQQKLVLARELARDPDLLVANSPTRGLDLAATVFVRNQLVSLAREGAGVLLITTDLDEAREIADRIFVLYRGGLSSEFSPASSTASIGAAMGGLA